MIYAIRAVGTQYIKFGQTAEVNIRDRINLLKTGCPHELELVAFGLGGREEEKRIHQFLKAAGRHHRLEWFIDSPEAQEAIAWIKDREKPLPELPPLVKGEHRLSRLVQYAKNHSLECYVAKEKKKKCPKPETQEQSIPTLADMQPGTEEAFRFMQSLLDWESSVARNEHSLSQHQGST